MLVPFASPRCTFYSQRTPKIPTKNRSQVLTLSAHCLPNIFAGKHCRSLNLSRKVEQPSGERTHSSSILIYLNQQAAIAFAIIIRQFVYLLTPLLRSSSSASFSTVSSCCSAQSLSCCCLLLPLLKRIIYD